MRSLWTPEEAWDYLDTWHYRMDEMDEYEQAKSVHNLMSMKHRPNCRTHLQAIMPNYGADCTCDAKYEDSWHGND